MVPSLKRLLGESIDYSGCGAAGELSVFEALNRFLRYQCGPESWILSRFVCPAAGLQDLAKALGQEEITANLPVAVRASTTNSSQEWEKELERCAEAMNLFDTRTPDLVEVAAFEIRPPAAVTIAQALRDLQGFSEVDVFIEPTRLSDHESLFAAMTDNDWVSLKFDLAQPSRPDSFLTAKLLHEAVAVELPFKVVQGSGHATTFPNEYGLINLLGAVAFAISEDLSSRELEAALVDPDWGHWGFERDSFSLRGWEADAETIEQARDLFVGIECGSVERAIDDLASLGFAVREGV